MKNTVDRIIAKAWLEGNDPKEMLEKENISLPADFKMPHKPEFKLHEEISRHEINNLNSHLDSAYCYCG